jgi:TetR/AcrR family transcriptional regulator, fatty acid metabolism regulator protein
MGDKPKVTKELENKDENHPKPKTGRTVKSGSLPRGRKASFTRDQIIGSAKTLFAENGYVKTTVVEICSRVGLSEASLYEHFKGKEDLLLAIPELWVTQLLQELEDQMFGIEGAFNKLRKYIWWTLRRTEEAPLDAKIVYLFLKTNAGFLETSVYANVKILYNYLLAIFEEGKRTGEMRPDLDSYVARRIVIGVIDHIVTVWLLKDMSFSLFEKVEETFTLLESAFSSKERLQSKAE